MSHWRSQHWLKQSTCKEDRPDVVTTATIASNFKKEALERLPVGRALNDAVLLAPGVTGTGPSGNIMISGALSFESLFLINGVVVNENLRGAGAHALHRGRHPGNQGLDRQHLGRIRPLRAAASST